LAEEGLVVRIVGEDGLHHVLAKALSDAALDAAMSRHDWFEVDHHRVHRTGPVANVRVHGHLDGKPIGPGGARLRSDVVSAMREAPRPAMVVVVVDSDGERSKDKMEAAERVAAWAASQGWAVAIGVANPEAEAWLMLVDPSVAERQRFELATRALEFDPRREPHRLSSKPDSGKDAKRVARFVFLEEAAEIARCRSVAFPACDAKPLAKRLCDRSTPAHGRECGLAPFREALAAAAQSSTDRHFGRPTRE
jgi:hypothetical protein